MATDLLVCSLQVFESLPELHSEVYACPQGTHRYEFSVTSRAIIYENLSEGPVRATVPKAVYFNI